jgi:uncharacterized protein YegP (UPF0339 family)
MAMSYSESPGVHAGVFVISRSWAGNYVWKLQDADGNVLETSTNRYPTYESCREAVERIRRVASTAVVHEHDEGPRSVRNRLITSSRIVFGPPRPTV